MKRTSVAAALSALALGALLLAKEPAPPKKDKGGWKKLFDGKTMGGWKVADFFGKGKAHVQDGAIVLEEGKQMTGITYVRGDFPTMDYEVTLEGKRIAGDDFFCTTTFPVGDSFCSFVVGGWGGKTVGLSSIDFEDASRNETNKSKEFKTGQWYRLRIRVTKKKIEAWIDREKMVDLGLADRNVSIRVECSRCKPFGIATWQTTGAVRDVRVRALSEAEKKGPGEKIDTRK